MNYPTNAKRPTRTVLSVLGGLSLFVILPVTIAWAQQTEQEVEISVEELPPVIQQALHGVDVDEVERVTSGGKVIFEITIKEDDVEFEMALDGEGHLLAVEVEGEDDDEDGDDEDGDDEDDEKE